MSELQDFLFPLSSVLVDKCKEKYPSGRVIAITGSPGSGKSVLLHQLFAQLTKLDFFLTAIDASLLERSSAASSVCRQFQKVAGDNKTKILILDSLDVLAHTNRVQLRKWLLCIDKLKEISNLIVICAVRTFEAEHFYPLNIQRWSEKYDISHDLNTSQFDEYVQKSLAEVGSNYDTISSALKVFLRVPLHLRIVTKILRNGGSLKNIVALHGIYTELLNALGVFEKPNTSVFLSCLADRMLKEGITWLPYSEVLHNKEIAETLKKGILVAETENNRIMFFHQTLIDYFCAIKVVRDERSLYSFIIEHKQNPFIRPTLYHILSVLRDRPASLFIQLADIYFGSPKDKIRYFMKVAILTAIGSWTNPSKKEADFLWRILDETSYGDFKVQFFSRHPSTAWFPLLKETVIVPCLSNEKNRWTISKYLVDVTQDYPGEIIDLAMNCLENNPSRDTEWFIERIVDKLESSHVSREDEKKLSILIEKTIKAGIISWDHEIIHLCKRLARSFPQKALELYLSETRKLLKQEQKQLGSQNALLSSFDELLQEVYRAAPNNTISQLTEFFEETFSERYESGRVLLDSPIMLLYGQRDRHGVEGIYGWYMKHVLSFMSHTHPKAKTLIDALTKSCWETQRELSLLCKLEYPKGYEKDIEKKIHEFLSAIRDSRADSYSSYTFRMLLEKGLAKVPEQTRKKIIAEMVNLNPADKSDAWEWLWGPLHHIPREFVSGQVKEKLTFLTKTFGFTSYRYAPSFSTSGSYYVGSPISGEALKQKSPKKLLVFLEANRNLKESHTIVDGKLLGGVLELAQEAAKVITSNAKRYKNIIKALAVNPANDIYTEWIIAGFANSEAEDREREWLIPLIETLWKRENLQLDVVRYFRKIASLITPGQFLILKPILNELANAKDPERDRFFEYRKKGYANDALTEGINSVRGVLCEVLLRFPKEITDDIYNILSRLSDDPTVSVRASLVAHLPLGLRRWGWEKCWVLFSRSATKFPEEYSELIKGFLRYVPKEHLSEVKELLVSFRKSGSNKLIEAYVSLIVLFYFRGLLPLDEVLALFADDTILPDNKREGFDIAVNQIEHEAGLRKAIPVIDYSIRNIDTYLHELTFMFLKAKGEDIKYFVPMIDKMLEYPRLYGELISYMLDFLVKGLLYHPLIVFRVLERILNYLESFVRDGQYQLEIHKATRSDAPVNIVNAVLEGYPEHTEDALKALDKLIFLQCEGVDNYLASFDRL